LHERIVRGVLLFPSGALFVETGRSCSKCPVHKAIARAQGCPIASSSRPSLGFQTDVAIRVHLRCGLRRSHDGGRVDSPARRRVRRPGVAHRWRRAAVRLVETRDPVAIDRSAGECKAIGARCRRVGVAIWRRRGAVIIRRANSPCAGTRLARIGGRIAVVGATAHGATGTRRAGRERRNALPLSVRLERTIGVALALVAGISAEVARVLRCYRCADRSASRR
jgi:hypothetical protein